MTLDDFARRVDMLIAGGLKQIVLTEMVATGKRAEAAGKLNATSRMRKRTGYLRNSIVGGGEIRGNDIVTYLRAGGGARDVGYARIQEQGGTVRPGPGKRFLAMPVGPALTGAGVARFASPRDVPGLRFQSIRGGAMGLLVKDYAGRGKRKTGSRSEVWYVLMRSATVPAHWYLRDARDEAATGLPDRLRARVSRTLGAA